MFYSLSNFLHKTAAKVRKVFFISVEVKTNERIRTKEHSMAHPNLSQMNV